ncbi:YadA family autotransporter adhesin, partial [Pseudomonas sp. OV226]|uniref:YadA family autotransporter adhesin n=1 Tax=Pseudomonas sp. OV226 TaxID=2135588 RepID=UPI000D791FAA
PTANGGNGAFSASHGGAGPNKITNVAPGDVSANSTDVVNGSQLFALDNRVTAVDDRVTNIEGSFTNINNGAGIKYFHTNSTGVDSVANGADSTAVGPNATASASSSIAMGNGANTTGSGAVALGEGASSSAAGSVALGQGASDGGRGIENYTGKYSGADNNTVGTVSVGNAITGATRTISNVADGKEATDAVNLRQLDGAVAESKQYTDDSISQVNTTVTNVGSQIKNIDKRVTKTEGDITHLQNGTDGMFQVNNSSNLPKPDASGSDAVAGGAGSQASGSNSTALGSKAKAKANNSVALGAGSIADRENSVSVGAAGSERQITNLAAGTSSTDAVNLGQLNSGLADATKNANAYTDSAYRALHKDIKQLDDDLSAGIAGAMAMAALPQPYAPGASMTSGALSTYRGQSSMALGVSRISDNGHWVAKLQATANTQRDVGASVGVGYQW